MMGMGTPTAASSATAAFWQQARQLPHMNTFQTNSPGMGHTHAMPHQYNPTHHTSHQPHDAKMAEKIVSELQVNLSFKKSGKFKIL